MWIDNLHNYLKIGLRFLKRMWFSQTLRAMLMSRTSFKIGLKFKNNIVKVSFGLVGKSGIFI